MQGEISETKKTVETRIHCDAEDAEKKVNCLVELLKEANALVDELASKGIKFKNDLTIKETIQSINATLKRIEIILLDQQKNKNHLTAVRDALSAAISKN